MPKTLLTIKFLLLSFVFLAQGEHNNWNFGARAGITFNSSPAVSHTLSQMPNGEFFNSISDANGNLLFYTNGDTIWNAQNLIMSNGTNLGGNFGPTIILKSLTNNNIYYVFTLVQSSANTGWYAISQSLVDMTLSSGSGSVTVKNVIVVTGSFVSKFATTKHCNGSETWLCLQDFNSTTLKSYLFTATGLNTTPIVSNVGTISSLGGDMCFSPNGRKALAANQFSTSTCLTLYDFDNSTGQFSNPVSSPTISLTWYHGCAFSSDGTKAYCSSTSVPTYSSQVFQIDICSIFTAAPTLNLVSIATTTSTCFQRMQLAPDSKIYIAEYKSFQIFSSWLGVINNPNNLGAACNFNLQGISLSNRFSLRGLPAFATNYLVNPPNIGPFSYTTTNIPNCYFTTFSAPNASNSPFGVCSSSGYSLTGVLWDFGDPMSGAANTAGALNPTHNFSNVGSYNVKMILYYSCGGGTDTISQIVNINQPCISIQSASITCATLGSATVTTNGSIGPFSYTWSPSAQTNSIATGLAPGLYSITVYDQGLNTSATGTVLFLSPIPLTGTLSNANSITCNGAATGTAQFTNMQGGSANQNYLWTNGTQTYTTAFTNSLSAGIWSVNVTDALTGCQINQSFFISQPPALSPTLTISTPSICAGSSAILSATNSGGTPAYTYTFINGPVSFSSTITESVSGTHVYSVQITDANNCLSSATIALNVISNPNLIVPSVSICPTGPALFTATGATSYTWLPPAANGSVTGSAASPSATINFTDLPASNTQYTLIGSDLGCTSTTTTSVFIYISPTPIISSNSPKCEGSNAVISVSGGTAAVWSGPNVFSSNNLSNTIAPIGLSNAGVYSTTITSANGCTASANATFVVNPTPTVSAVGSTVCTTQTMSLFANSLSGSSYQWFGLNNYSALVQNPTLANPSLNRTGSYTVIVTAPTSCTSTAIAQVSVTSPPSLSIALSSNSLCAQAFNGSPNTITLTSSGAHTYTLYTPNLLGSSTPVAPSASLFATPPFSSTLAAGIATLQGSNGVCTSTSSFVFTVVPNPTVGVNSFTPVICAGKNFTYTSNGANSYVWSATSPNYTTYSNGGVAVAHPSINAVFSVYGSSLGCQSALVSSSITVFPLPSITLSALSSSICLYDKTNLSVSGTGTSFQWLPLTGLNTYTGSLVNCGTQVNQVYTVIASANNCTAAATTSIHVWPLPTAKITGTTSNVCLNENIKLSGEGGVQFNWFGPGNIAVGGQSVSINAWSPGVGGTYTLVVTDINSCKNASTTNISILALPDGSLKNFKEEVCAPFCTTYNFEGFNSKTISSNWVINSSTITSNVFSTCFKDAGTYTLQGKLLDNSTSCKSEISYVVTVRPKPTADFLFLPRTPIENLDEVAFTNTSSGDGLLTYHWYFNDNKGFSTTNKNTSYLYSETGDYRVVLVTKNNFGCADTVLKLIRVEPDFALYVPNTFTPNDDNRNDVFLASVRSSKLFDLKIYDRWGAEIFHAKSPNDGWDGTFRGMACKQDTYTWVIELSTVGGERLVKSGTVVLLR